MKNELKSNLIFQTRKGIWKSAILLAAFSATTFAATITVSETVSGQAGPWTYVNGGLNTAYQYGVGDEAPPVVVDVSNGLNFASGNQITIQYVSGLVSAGPGFPYVSAEGDLNAVTNNGPGSSGKLSPSAFMNPATYPTYLTELVGTFANGAGAIVGTPFAVGDGPLTLTIPSGASSLELGVNDDIYGDNSGAFLVDVTGSGASSTAPEPTTVGFLLAGVASAWTVRQRQLRRIVKR